MENSQAEPKKSEKAKKLATGAALFVASGLVTVGAACAIKELEKDGLRSEEVTEEKEVVPVDQAVLDAQKKINEDREAKLRDLNTTPTETVKKEIVEREVQVPKTTTTTTTKKSDSDKKTKSS